MKYQEKIEMAKNAADKLSNKISNKEVRNELSTKGYYPQQVDEIMRSANNLLSHQYGPKIKEYLIDGSFDEHRLEFDFLEEDVMDAIKNSQTKLIQSECKKKVDELVKLNYEELDIVSQVQNKVFTEFDIYRRIDFYKKHNFKITGEEKRNYLTLGLASIIAGIGLSLFTMIGPASGGKSILFYGLIIFGVYNLIKAYSTRGEIENM